MKVLKEHVKALYQMLSKETGQTPKVFHFDNFELIDEKLYRKGKSTSLTIRGGRLSSVDEIVNILAKERLQELGFDIHRGKLMAQQAIMMNKVEDLPSTSDIAKADNIEIQKITENAARSTENLIE